jgi:hypothetical protein
MWHKAQAQPSQSRAGRPHFLSLPARDWHIFENRFIHVSKEVDDAQCQCGQETWPPKLAGQPNKWAPEPHSRPKHRLNPPINTPRTPPSKKCEESEV